MNTVLIFHYFVAIYNQLLECDNALWGGVYNKIIIPTMMGSCKAIICITMRSCATFHWKLYHTLAHRVSAIR